MTWWKEASEVMPCVSVIMPAQNEEPYIGAAIESVLQQSYSNLELLVINDYSVDRTAEVVCTFRDPRIRLCCKTDGPPGRAASRNLGIQMARGAFIAYQDADDYSHPNRIELQVREALAGDRPRAVGTWVERRTATGSRTCQLPVCHEQIVAGFRRAYNRVTLVAGTMLLPRSIALAIPFRARFKYLEDWDQICRIHESGTAEFRNLPEVLYTYNIRPKGSKGQQDWACYNVFERACRARRRAGLAEWSSLEQFEAYLADSPLDCLIWTGCRQLVRLKASIEMRLARATPRGLPE
jgi:glycosyltransferase involved in cell wall biosynthesis